MIGGNHEHVATDWNAALNRGPVGFYSGIKTPLSAFVRNNTFARLDGGSGGAGHPYASADPRIKQMQGNLQGKP